MAMMATLLQAQTSVMRADSVTTPAGKVVSLPVILENIGDVTGVQFDIYVPYELKTDKEGNFVIEPSHLRIPGHTVLCRQKGRHWYDYLVEGVTRKSLEYYCYRVMVYSDRKDLVIDDRGTLLTMHFAPDLLHKDKDVLPIFIENVVLSSPDKQDVPCASAAGAVIIEEIPRPDLVPTDITFTPSTLEPCGKIGVSWVVKNIGQAPTESGWTEQVSLVSIDGTVRKLITTTYYDNTLAVGGSVSRTLADDVVMPALLGIDGVARVEVQVVPTDKTGEHPSLRDNNTQYAADNINIGKRLTLEFSKTRFTEGGSQRFSCKLNRSGRWTNIRTFSITSSDTRLETPATVTIPMNQSGTLFYLTVNDNDVVDADSVVTITVVGDNYEPATAQIVIEDNEYPQLGVTSSKSMLTEGEEFVLTITTPRVSDQPTEVQINSEDNKRFSFPSAAVIPAGQSQVQVTVKTKDDEVPNLVQSNKFTVSAKNLSANEVIVILEDNDIPALTMTLTPHQVSEASGLTSVAAMLTRTGKTNNKITVKLTDDSNGGLYYSNKSIVMDKGVETVFFNLGPVDNTQQEGDRTYHLTAAIWVSSCNCSTAGQSAGNVTAELTVLDNDGAALAVASDASTVKEGGETTLTVLRNTVSDVSQPLTVTLSSNFDADLDYEKSVTIPAGQTGTTVTVRSKKNDVPGDSHTVIFTVAAQGYASGTCFLLVTDQTLPDARIEAIESSISEAVVGTTFSISVTVKNVGAYLLPSNTPVSVYRRGSSSAVFTAYTEADLPVDSTMVISRKLTVPESVGDHVYYAIVNPNNNVTELVYTNNTSADITVKGITPFTAKVQTDKAVYRQGEKVLISGQLTGTQSTDAQIDVYLVNDGAREVKQVRTDAAGKFSLEWQLFELQTGHFSVGACFAGDPTTEEMATFDVCGLRRVDSGYITCEVTCGEPYTGVIRLVNAGKLPLSGVKAQVVSAPEGCEALFQLPEDIGAGETVSMAYTLNGKTGTPGKDWEQLKVQVTSTEGASLEMTLHYYARLAQGNLVVEKQNLITTMNIDTGRDYSFFVTNTGKGNTGRISLSLPQFMTALTGTTMPGLNQKDTATVVVRMMPDSDMQLNMPVTGMMGINCENGNGTYIKYSITPVSDKTGTLVIDVTDEYTYYTDEKPHVSGAEVVLKNPVTGVMVAQGLSDDNGLFTIELPEGYYQVNVTADKHDSYKNTILVDPGTTTTKVVCLSYQAISVSWGVEETEVEDEYNIVTTVKFETNVPAPVVEVVEPDVLDIGQLGAGESMVYYAILTNKGLINANNTSYTIPEMAGDCMLEPLVESKGLTLFPQQSYTIPVKVTRMSRESSTHSINDGFTESDTQWLWDYKPDVTPPVVEVTEPDAVNIDNLGVGDKTTYTVTLTNTGSVPVKDVSYTVPIVSGDYRWKATGENTGIYLDSGESVTITIEVTHLDEEKAENLRNSGSQNRLSSSKNGRCIVQTVTDYNWECGSDNKWGWYPHTIKLEPPVDCSTSSRGLWTVYGHGLGSPGGDDGNNSYASSANYSGASYSAECNPCLKNLTNMVLDAGDCAAIKFVPFVGCAWGVGRSIQGLMNNWYEGNAKDWALWGVGTFSTVMGCLPGASTVWGIIGCGLAIYDISTGCGDKPNSARLNVKRASSTPSWVDEFAERMKVGGDYFQANQDFCIEFYGDPAWGNLTTVEEALSLNNALEEAIKNDKVDVDALRAYKPKDISNEQFNLFIERVQNSLSYDMEIPNPAVTNVIRPEVLMEYLKIMQRCNEIAIQEYGYENVGGVFDVDFQKFVERLREESTSTCATISLQIDQTMTMTRQAFRGTLTVTNGNKELPITDAKLKLNVTNRQTGLTATAKEFEMHAESLKMFKGDLDMESGWYLGPDSTGVATILFIPSKYAAPDEPVEYSFGGTLSYIDPNSDLEVTRELFPVTLTVKPSPELDLTYFMQRDLYGDDALTEVIEPVVPGEFALIINNKGNGDATNVRMVTKQPQIIENEKGLFINFEFVSSQLNGQEKAMAMGESIPTEFGNIPAHTQAYAQWWLESSLLGHFVDYDIKATHVSSYGNENLSLLDEVTIHELIHGFTPGDSVSGGIDVGRAFLVNDIRDADDLPDQVYFTNATQDDVSIAADATIEKVSSTEYTLTVYPSAEGWNYGSLLDPTVGRRKLLSIMCLNDSTELPVDNMWQTDRTMIDGKEWRYENRLHYIANFDASTLVEGVKYSLTFEDRSDVVLEVVSITGMEKGDQPVRTTPVDEVTVTFNKFIDGETFDKDDVKLNVQGQTQDLSTVKFASADSIVWKLDFTELNRTLPNGYYVLTVQTSEIKDYEGYNGMTGRKADWVLFIGGLVQLTTSEYPLYSGTILREKIIDTGNQTGARRFEPADGNVIQTQYGDRYRLTATANDGYEFVNWTLDGAVISTNPIYETTVKGDQNLVANFKKRQCRLDVTTNEGGYITGNGSGLYDMNTEVVIIARPVENYILDSWKVDGKFVYEKSDTLRLQLTKATTVEALFVRSIYTQTLTFGRGWNWISTYLKDEQSLANVTKYASRVLSQENELAIQPEDGLVGNINFILPGVSYKVKSPVVFSVSMRGRTFSATDGISLKTGWNWIAYPRSETQPLCVITNAEDGDCIAAQDGFASFNGTNWEGTIGELMPGSGYLYKSATDKTLAFSYNGADGAEVTYANLGGTVVRDLSYQYPSTMNFIARGYREGVELVGDRYNIYAYAGDELRGVGQLVGQNYYLTVYGEEPVNISFVVEDAETGETFTAKPVTVFVEDVLGTRQQPFAIPITTGSDGIDQLQVGTGRTTVYTVEGILVARNATIKTLHRLPKGIYIVNGRKMVVK